MDFELAIIGAGPAGYSAGIYAGRSGIKTIVFDKSGGGGLALLSPNIENYAGFESISGTELMDKMDSLPKSGNTKVGNIFGDTLGKYRN